jgi:hypothetical protein
MASQANTLGFIDTEDKNSNYSQTLYGISAEPKLAASASFGVNKWKLDDYEVHRAGEGPVFDPNGDLAAAMGTPAALKAERKKKKKKCAASWDFSLDEDTSALPRHLAKAIDKASHAWYDKKAEAPAVRAKAKAKAKATAEGRVAVKAAKATHKNKDKDTDKAKAKAKARGKKAQNIVVGRHLRRRRFGFAVPACPTPPTPPQAPRYREAREARRQLLRQQREQRRQQLLRRAQRDAAAAGRKKRDAEQCPPPPLDVSPWRKRASLGAVSAVAADAHLEPCCDFTEETCSISASMSPSNPCSHSHSRSQSTTCSSHADRPCHDGYTHDATAASSTQSCPASTPSSMNTSPSSPAMSFSVPSSSFARDDARAAYGKPKVKAGAQHTAAGDGCDRLPPHGSDGAHLPFEDNFVSFSDVASTDLEELGRRARNLLGIPLSL